MSNFILDNTTLPYPKIDLYPLAGKSPSQYVTADNWGVVCQALVDVQGFLRGHFQLFNAGDPTKKCDAIVVVANPNGTVTAQKGSLAVDIVGPGLYQNTNGAMAWSAVGGGGGGSPFVAGGGSGSALLSNGTGNAAAGANATAEGSGTSAGGSAAHAGGTNTVASGNNSIAHGSSSTATGSASVSLGDTNHATNTRAVAIGGFNTASGLSSTAVGESCQAIGSQSMAIGAGGQAQGNLSFAVGQDVSHPAVASGQSSVAIGAFSAASAFEAIAVGHACIASANNAVALGHSAQATAVDAMALGRGIAGGVASLATQNSTANGARSAAFNQSTATGVGSTAMCQRANALREGQFAVASGRFVADGDMQTSLVVMHGSTAGGGANESVELFFGESNDQSFSCEDGKAYAVDVTVVAGAVQGGPRVSRGFKFSFAARRDAGVTTIAGTSAVVDFGDAATNDWTVVAAVAGGPDRIALTFTTGAIPSITSVVAKFAFTETVY